MKLPLWVRMLIARVEAGTSGYFPASGWIRSRATRMAIDSEQKPIPWFTYPAIQFLAQRVTPDMRVLEFGAGLGTAWWADHCAEVLAVEHDAHWSMIVASRCSARLIAVESGTADAYISPARPLGPFDIVVVDGLYRNECLRASLELLSDAGVIILDDSQRPEYDVGSRAVQDAGFRRLDFAGPAPVSKHAGCTTVFYRSLNAFDI